MQRYQNNFSKAQGNSLRPVGGASVLVTTIGGAVATIYSDNGVTTTANPLTTDANGMFAFYAADGRYSLTITSSETATVVVSDILLEDPQDGSPMVINGGTISNSALSNVTIDGIVFGGSDIAKYSVLDEPDGASRIGTIQTGTGAVARTVEGKLRETVSVKDFGAVGDGVADDSAAIQLALNSGAKTVYVPYGDYLCGDLLMPNTVGFILHGDVGSSRLVQKGGGTKLLRWDTSSIHYTQGHIKSLSFKGTNGANHVIDTSGVGGLTLSNIYIEDVPTGFSGVYVNGAAATYVHDIRINGLQIYSNTAGHSGVRFGPLTSDSSLTDFIMNGNFVVDYCAYYDVGAQTIRMTDAHPYNAAINIVKMAGSNNQCAFEDTVFDNAIENLVEIASSSFAAFTNTWFEAIRAAKSGLNLVSAVAVTMVNTRFEGAVGAAAAVTGDSGSTDANIMIGSLGVVANYVTPFSFAGVRCYARGFPGHNPQALTYSFSGTTTSAQAQNTTQYLGVNGGQATINNTYYVVPEDGTLADFYVASGATPAVGQTFTFNLQKNGSTVATITVSNGGFGGNTVTANVAVSRGDQVAIQSVFSETSGSSNVRYTVRFKA